MRMPPLPTDSIHARACKLKCEKILTRPSFETFAKAVDGYINYYNNERIQEKTKWMPPTKFREASMCT